MALCIRVDSCSCNYGVTCIAPDCVGVCLDENPICLDDEQCPPISTCRCNSCETETTYPTGCQCNNCIQVKPGCSCNWCDTDDRAACTCNTCNTDIIKPTGCYCNQCNSVAGTCSCYSNVDPCTTKGYCVCNSNTYCATYGTCTCHSANTTPCTTKGTCTCHSANTTPCTTKGTCTCHSANTSTCSTHGCGDGCSGYNAGSSCNPHCATDTTCGVNI